MLILLNDVPDLLKESSSLRDVLWLECIEDHPAKRGDLLSILQVYVRLDHQQLCQGGLQGHNALRSDHTFHVKGQIFESHIQSPIRIYLF